VSLLWQIAGVGDLDADGKADVVWRQTQTGDVATWLMNGAAIKRTEIVWFGVAPEWQIVGVEDTDGDRRVDLIWRQAQTGDVAIWLMTGAAIKQSAVAIVGDGSSLNWSFQ
jgi:hypothetical protein